MTEKNLVETQEPYCPPRKPWRALAYGTAALLGLLLVLHLTGALVVAGNAVVQRLPQRPADALLGIVDVFSCCILSWKALTTMLPAFILGGAIAAFVPSTVILRYLGSGAHKGKAYTAAAVSGVVLSLCSCNIVPLFVSIYRRGAGIGPAFTFLFAGPAINVVAIIFTIQVIGWRLGLWRAVGVPIIALLVGLLMAFIFRREEQERANDTPALVDDGDAHARIWWLFAMLLALVVLGSWEMPWTPRLIGMGVLVAGIVTLAFRKFERYELADWMRESWGLIKLVIPVLIPAVLAIGAIAAFIDVKLVYRMVGPAPDDATFWQFIQPILVADIFGCLMYFPILSEVAFTKAFLKLGMDVGPALAVLLTGPGLSLPGTFIIARAVGWKKTAAYQLVIMILSTTLAAIFASEVGQYICACMME